MQSGGPIAFYEIAATLIPLLLLGGVALELARPPKSRGTSPTGTETKGAGEEESESFMPGGPAWHAWWIDHRSYLMRRLVPAFGFLAILVETFALHAVATGSIDRWHALFVWGGLLVGMVVAVVGVWLPWLSQRFDAPVGRIALISGTLLLGAFYFLSGLLQAPVASVFDAVSTPPSVNEGLPPEYKDALWLAHLVTSSDFRIERLKRAGPEEGLFQESASRHLATQVVLHDRQCRVLDQLIGHRSATGLVGQWTCPRPGAAR